MMYKNTYLQDDQQKQPFPRLTIRYTRQGSKEGAPSLAFTQKINFERMGGNWESFDRQNLGLIRLDSWINLSILNLKAKNIKIGDNHLIKVNFYLVHTET